MNKTITLSTISMQIVGLFLVMVLVSPLLATAQATSSEEMMDDNGDDPVISETTMSDDTATGSDDVMDDGATSTNDDMVDVEDATPIEDLSEEDSVAIEGEIIMTEDDIIYVQTDDGIIEIDTANPENDDVLIITNSTKKSSGSSKLTRQWNKAQVGDTVMMSNGDSVQVDTEIRGKIVSLVGDVITVLLANGQQQSFTVHPSASFVTASGNKVTLADLSADDEIILVADSDDAIQIVVGSEEELEEITAETTEEEGGLPNWAIVVGLVVLLLIGWMFIRK